MHSFFKHYSYKMLNLQTTSDEITSILAAKEKLLDTMGVYQHHDAITGTEKQFVAYDYSIKLIRAMNQNKLQMNKIAKEMSMKLGSIDSDTWSMCEITNETYLNCPNKDYAN